MNRRKVATVAADLLALSCLGADALRASSVVFEFKHFEGYCLLRLSDSDVPVTTSQYNRAEAEAEAHQDGVRLSPLAAVLKTCQEVQTGGDMNRRVVTAKIATFDPRKASKSTAGGDDA